MNSIKMRQLINDQLAGINYKSIKNPKQMSVEIQSTDDQDQILVNGKTVRKDMDGVWRETAELTTTERRFFAEYLSMLTKTNWRGHTATYTT
jgi:hypothetical protein